MQLLFSGEAISSHLDDQNVVEIIFNLQGESVNKCNKKTLGEFKKVIQLLPSLKNVRGLIISSGKDAFIAGADITEFLTYFKLPSETLRSWLGGVHEMLNTIEDLPYPTFSLINGYAFGGGLEFALSTTYRLLEKGAKVGLPETKLGIIPGWGGTIRLPRLIGVDNALEWITSGKQGSDQEAFKVGIVDAILEKKDLKEGVYAILKEIELGKRDWKSKQLPIKKGISSLSECEAVMAFETAKGMIMATFGPQFPSYPAPFLALNSIQKSFACERDKAQKIEIESFVEATQTESAKGLVQLFLNEQLLKKTAKTIGSKGSSIKSAATLGAGIMGGGIAYQNCSKGIPVLMKDIKEEAVTLGLNEANKLFQKVVEIGKASIKDVTKGLNLLHGTLSYGEFDKVDIVIEAVVENAKVKKQVYSEVEKHLSPTSLLVSNTSTISITELAKGLARPQNFCGMHFFNPVHKMPLVEVIKGKESSPETIATVVKYADQLGKKPIVVDDCPGFYVNRILFPYFIGFMKMVEEGFDFNKIDKVMEKFGWPMGPSYLLDVVGIDTCFHCLGIMSEGYPTRMNTPKRNLLSFLYEEEHYGQKNGKGFFAYTIDKKGKPQKAANPKIDAIIKKCLNPSNPKQDCNDKDIVDRMMIPMMFEAIRALEEKIISSPVDGDAGVLYGLGFPPFRTGVFAYADSIGLKELKERSLKFSHLGEMYKAPDLLEMMIKENRKFYPDQGAN